MEVRRPDAPLCPICGADMHLRHSVRRAYRDRIEVWQCRRCGTAGHAFAALIARRRAPRRTAVEPTRRRLRSLGMTPSATRRLLEEAEQAIRHCRRHQERQLGIIAKRERGGHDASQARQLLKTLQQLQAEHEAHRDRLAAELAERA
jgi:hypothetical protein